MTLPIITGAGGQPQHPYPVINIDTSGAETNPLTDTELRAAPVPVIASANENHIGKVSGSILNPSSAFTRPADTTAYSSGDLVANNTVAGNVTPMQFTAARVAEGSFMIRRARMYKSGTSITTAAFRLHLYKAAPTVTNGDNGVFSSSGAASYIGALDITVDQAFTDGAFGASDIDEMSVKLDSGQIIYGLLEARGAYAPTSSEVFTLFVELIPN